jgi:hypothetical protein
MTEQTEALRLANALEEKPDSDGHCRQAAAELRRLEAEVERKAAGIKFLWQECDRQERINAQLLEALEFIADRQDLMFAECSDAEEIIEVARAAIAAAKGEA